MIYDAPYLMRIRVSGTDVNFSWTSVDLDFWQPRRPGGRGQGLFTPHKKKKSQKDREKREKTRRCASSSRLRPKRCDTTDLERCSPLYIILSHPAPSSQSCLTLCCTACKITASTVSHMHRYESAVPLPRNPYPQLYTPGSQAGPRRSPSRYPITLHSSSHYRIAPPQIAPPRSPS
jgi:hypothetical protein